MYRATGEEGYRETLRRLCEVLLDFEVRFNDVAGQPASGFPYGIGTIVRPSWTATAPRCWP